MEIKGFTYGWDSHKGMLGTEKANESVKALAAMGGNWAALAFAVTQEKFSSSRFGMDFRFVDTDREIETAIKQLKDSGLKVCLKLSSTARTAHGERTSLSQRENFPFMTSTVA